MALSNNLLYTGWVINNRNHFFFCSSEDLKSDAREPVKGDDCLIILIFFPDRKHKKALQAF